MKKLLLLTVLFIAPLLSILIFSSAKVSVKDQTMLPLNSSSLQSISETAWQSLATKKIIFGHQSVGFNIIEGMEDLRQENQFIDLKIIANAEPWEVKTPGFVHFQIGENTQPQTKINDFVRVVETTEQQGSIDLAFFKFCYVDIGPDTNINEVFEQYQQAMQRLIQAFPKTTFIHVTVPLESEAGSIKRWARQVKNFSEQFAHRGKSRYSSNFYRHQFNQLIRQAYQEKAPVFDLAQIESTFPDGHQQIFSVNGKQYWSLVPDYTDDGGHLNQLGRRVVAEKLLIFLARLNDRDP